MIFYFKVKIKKKIKNKMSEEFNNLENKTTSFCTFVQDDSNEINFQKVKEIEVNVHAINGNNNLEENHIQEINANNVNSNNNDEEIIGSGFQLDINSNYLNQKDN